MKVSVDDMSHEIIEALKEYGTAVAEVVDDALEITAKDAIDGLKFASPKESGKYAGGWKQKSQSRKGFREIKIYQSKKPGLTHLLEFGHAKRGGGRVAARRHIADAQDFAEYELHSLIQEGIRKVK